MKSICGCAIVWLGVLGVSQGLFVPEQIPSLLSFIYTNIPTIRKGTDSRVGFGFRVGPNADFQVVLELGPQANTAALGPQPVEDNSVGNSKREAIHGAASSKNGNRQKPTWLQAWRNQQVSNQNDDNVGTVKLQPELNRDVVAHLHQLYKEDPTKSSTSSAVTQPPSQNSISKRIGTLHNKFRSFRKMKNRLIV